MSQPPVQRVYAGPTSSTPRPKRRSIARIPLAVLAFAAASGFVLVNVVDPTSGAVASPYYQAPARFSSADAQRVVVGDGVESIVSRDGFTVTEAPKPTPTPTPTPTQTAEAEDESSSESESSAPAVRAAAPSPGSAQAAAYEIIVAKGWADSEFDCLVSLWNRESGWNVYAENTSSGAYGIPQSLPGSKMASAGADWQTNAATQIKWGLGYIEGRYGSPCGAWAHSEDVGWY